MNSTRLRILDRLNIVTFLFSGEGTLNFSYLSCNTDVPTSRCCHNDNRFHADAPLSSGFYIWVLGCVSHSSLLLPLSMADVI